MTLCPWMPIVFFCPWMTLWGVIQGHFSGALKGRILIFPPGYHSLIRILSRFFTITPRVIRYHFLSGSFPADITPGILQDKRSTVIRSESTLDTYSKSYSEKTVGNYDDNFIRITCNTGDLSKSKITPCNYGMTLE